MAYFMKKSTWKKIKELLELDWTIVEHIEKHVIILWHTKTGITYEMKMDRGNSIIMSMKKVGGIK